MLSKPTVSFTTTFGVIPGYSHNNDLTNARELVISKWNTAMEDVYSKMKICVTGIFYESRTLYPTQWGCPDGGEITVTVVGNSNPHFLNKYFDDLLYKEAVITVVEMVRKELNQTTCQLTFSNVEHYYMKD